MEVLEIMLDGDGKRGGGDSNLDGCEEKDLTAS
jgi:hypothetical protein